MIKRSSDLKLAGGFFGLKLCKNCSLVLWNVMMSFTLLRRRKKIWIEKTRDGVDWAIWVSAHLSYTFHFSDMPHAYPHKHQEMCWHRVCWCCRAEQFKPPICRAGGGLDEVEMFSLPDLPGSSDSQLCRRELLHSGTLWTCLLKWQVGDSPWKSSKEEKIRGKAIWWILSRPCGHHVTATDSMWASLGADAVKQHFPHVFPSSTLASASGRAEDVVLAMLLHCRPRDLDYPLNGWNEHASISHKTVWLKLLPQVCMYFKI